MQIHVVTKHRCWQKVMNDKYKRQKGYLKAGRKVLLYKIRWIFDTKDEKERRGKKKKNYKRDRDNRTLVKDNYDVTNLITMTS